MKKRKYIQQTILCLLLGTCLTMCKSAPETSKQIVLINSYEEEHIGYGNFEEALKKSLKKANISANLIPVFLDCDKYEEQEEVERMHYLLDSLTSLNPDLIITTDDPAGYSGLKSNHPLLKQIPVILANLSYPMNDLIALYENYPVYTLRDSPDFLGNIDFIRDLHGNRFVKIIYNLDFTFLGKKSLSDILSCVAPEHIDFSIARTELLNDDTYNSLNKMFPQEIRDNLKPDSAAPPMDFVVQMKPFRYMTGLSLLNALAVLKYEQLNNVVLIDKLDASTRPLPQLLGLPAFSCARECFNKNLRVIGGYMATEERSVDAVTALIKELYATTGPPPAKVRDIPKEHVLDWNVLKSYDLYEIKNIPSYVRIINYPWYEKYRTELYVLGSVFVVIFITLIITLILIRQRTIKERKDTAILKNLHEQLSRSISGGNISLWRIKNKMIVFDENFTKLSGSKRLSFEFSYYLLFHHPDDIPLIEKAVEEIRVSREMQILRVRLNLHFSDYQWYEVRCNSFVDNEGEIILAGIIQNIQAIVDRENELIRNKELAEKAELKQSFLTNMSHEIRTPLNAIVGFTNILLSDEGKELDKTVKEEMLATINRNNDLLLKLIGDVLDISRLDSNNDNFTLHHYDIIPIVTEIFYTHQVIIHPQLEFRLEIDETESAYVNIDKIRFIQVISNFLSNANKFTELGYITLGCEVDRIQNEVNIYVEDSGKGIAQEQQGIIFDRFYKTDEFIQGTGLGLSICKVIIEKLSGRISVISQKGKGSRFTATLPLS